MVQKVDIQGQIEQRRVITNKVITAYGKSYIEGQIQDAYAEDRLLYVDKKRSHLVSGGTDNQLVSGRDSGFKKNIDNFWANVNYEKYNNRYSLADEDEAISIAAEQDAYVTSYEALSYYENLKRRTGCCRRDE